MCATPGIIEAAALAEPDQTRGEEVLAVVQHAQGCPDDSMVPGLVEAASQALETRLAVFKRPRYWVFVSDYPRTASIKVQKTQLRARIAGRRAYDLALGRWHVLP